MTKKHNTLKIRRKPKEHNDANKPLLELPIVKNIMALLSLPPALQDLPPLHLTHKTANNNELDCALWSYGELGMKFTMKTAIEGHESIEDFTTKSALQVANFFNSLVIPVFLLPTLKTQQKTPPPVMREWQNAIKLTYGYRTQGARVQRAFLPFVHETVQNADRNIHFFVVPGENIKQQLCKLEQIEANRIRSFEICVFIPNTLINTNTLEFAKHNTTSLQQVAFYLQMLPLYRSMLANSARDYGITSAPYKLGIGCAVLQAEHAEPAPQNNTTYYQQDLKSCVFIYGAQTINCPLSASFLHNSLPPIKMPSLTLFEVAGIDIPEAQITEILPYSCTLRRNVEYHQLLKQFLEARKIMAETAPVTQNRCTVLHITPNPKAHNKKAFTLKSLAEYLYLLTSSCETLFGNEHRVMAYAQTVQSVNGIPNVTLLHILDIGTLPKKQNHALVSETPNVFIYDEACHKATEDSESEVHHNGQDKITPLHDALGKFFTKAARNPKDSAIKALYRGVIAKNATDVRHFLESGKVQCVVVLQNVNTTAIVPPMQASLGSAHNKKEHRKKLPLSPTTHLARTAATVPRILSPPPVVQALTRRHSGHPLSSPSKPTIHTQSRKKTAPPLPIQPQGPIIHQQYELPTVQNSDIQCDFDHTNAINTPCTTTESPTDTKSLHLNCERSTLLLINTNKEPNMPSHSEPATGTPQPLPARVTYKSKLSQAFRDALFTFIGTALVAAAVGLTYFLCLRERYFIASAFRSDLVVGIILIGMVGIVAAITCTVMVREVLATKRAAILDMQAQQSPPAMGDETAKGLDGAPASQQHEAGKVVDDTSVPKDQAQATPTSASSVRKTVRVASGTDGAPVVQQSSAQSPGIANNAGTAQERTQSAVKQQCNCTHKVTPATTPDAVTKSAGVPAPAPACDVPTDIPPSVDASCSSNALDGSASSQGVPGSRVVVSGANSLTRTARCAS